MAGEGFLGPTRGMILSLQGSNLKLYYKLHTNVAAADTIVTGLTKILAAWASWETDAADANYLCQAVVGDQAGTPASGSIIVKSWKTDGSDPTPVAATTFSKKVSVLAIGY